jgi:hypothetical protein
MTLLLVVTLTVAGIGVHLAYRNPRLGAAILVGLGTATVLYVVWQIDPSLTPTTVDVPQKRSGVSSDSP